ncbi:MAG TPA: neutral zinc metallopeptidase [Actinophytocola sp.]|uniref:neutral zinc metallopeptidase n=1 Tax=Actinophytocola sp. TaxID=1872138 RepID=UPI002DBE75FE|nr:neutral zinc metallopeptidase [Actinophytocola sp.]HEU5471520.1 neutral zinc metallopeptidase [Actinophytocola sp.]
MSDEGDRRPHPYTPPPTVVFPPAPPPATILSATARQGKNTPLSMFGVLGMVIAFVLAVALLGRPDLFDGRTAVAGSAVAPDGLAAAPVTAGEAPAPKAPVKPRAVLELETNPLLAAGIGLPEVTCKLPGMSRDPEQLRAYYQAVITCLDQAWQPALAQANEPFSSPKLEIEAGRSMCGDAPSEDEATAYYCSGGRVIFMPTDRLLSQAGLSQAAHLAVLAHEYGHHVQALSGILNAAYEKGEEFDKETPERLEITRRTELQANCFSGMFIASIAGRGSVSAKLARSAADSFRDTVADDTHGSVKHQVQWGRAGYDKNQTSACNTWLAPDSEVS